MVPEENSVDQAVSRRRWLSQARRRYDQDFPNGSGLHLSTHGLLLQADLQFAFTAGAWAAVIVLAQAVIEATLRDLVTQDYEVKAGTVFKGTKRLERIRNLRNELLHPQAPGTPSLVWRIGGADIASNHSALESDARRAVEYMFYVVYSQRDAPPSS